MPLADEEVTAPHAGPVGRRAPQEHLRPFTGLDDAVRDIVNTEVAERIVLHALRKGSTAGIDDGAALRHQIVQSTQREFLSNGLLGR